MVHTLKDSDDGMELRAAVFISMTLEGKYPLRIPALEDRRDAASIVCLSVHL